ncbi:DEAD/DEAH box helicase [Bdellovibrionota bacterium FG-1]
MDRNNEIFLDMIALSPHGALYIPEGQESVAIPAQIRKAFVQGGSQGLFYLGLSEMAADLSPSLSYWRDFARLYFSQLCALPGLSESKADEVASCPPPREELEKRVPDAPPMLGAEYLSVEVLADLWQQLDQSFRQALKESNGTVQSFFESRGAAWSGVGKVCFHLAENKSDESAPFAFLATYSHKLSSQGKAQHLPLGRALQEYAGEKNKALLLKLLLPVQKASAASPFLKDLVETSEIFHPLAWTPEEAFRFLRDIPVFESSGVVVRVPDWWKTRHPPRPQVSVTVGGKTDSFVGAGALLDFSVEVTLEGESLTRKELSDLLAGTSGLALIRGKWVEIDREKLKEVLAHWKKVERAAGGGGLSFIEGMRLLSGAGIGRNSEEEAQLAAVSQWSQVIAGSALAQQLEQLREPGGKLKEQIELGDALKTILRPYQQVGLQWLWFLNRLGLGGCLADDMGLGKTIQVISLLLLLKREGKKSILVVPASLIGNWKAELDRFAPSLHYRIAHPSSNLAVENAQGADLVITTYGYLGRLPWLTETIWDLVVIDEAQAIKNAGSKQTRAVKALKARHRIALTGTPVENRLSDLWSLYDFLCPGLLGSAKEFERYLKGADQTAQHGYASLRQLVRPYLLRRLKTDKRIIADLPEKTEVSAYCGLTKTQAALYQQSVEELAKKIETLDGIQRRGIVLSYLMRFKQICNHPSQWLSDGRYLPEGSGKFTRLREICEEIAAKQEKVLIFTQFREMTDPLSQFLAQVFGRSGLVLHGETAVKKRKELVDSFQEKLGPPFFVLSLKAGGTGLNLTAASHVIHFDRWWNPAVENQATDRAYRIGQKKNVLVHKFVCRGTIEEKIELLIASKQSLSQEILEGGGEAVLTELSNSELLKLVALDIRSAETES